MRAFISIIFAGLLFATSASAYTIHVAPDGDDSNQGTKAKPLATLEGARDRLRDARSKEGDLPQGGVTVWVHGGTYSQSDSFVLSREDSGTEQAPIVYRAVPGEQVRLVAGRVIGSGSWKPLSASAQKRVHPGVDADKLLELDLKKVGVAYAVPKGRMVSVGLDLFANDRRQPVAQWPDLEVNILNMNDPGWTSCNGSKDAQSFFYGKGGAPQNNKDATNQLDLGGSERSWRWKRSVDEGRGLWLKGFWRTPWSPIIIPVNEINTDEEWIKLAAVPPGGMGSKYTASAMTDGVKQPWRVGSGSEKWLALNLLEEINLPGEWALDFKDGKIYYYPPAPIDTLNVMVADTPSPVVLMQGVSHVYFAGITLEGSLDYGMVLDACSCVKVAGCTVKNTYKGILIKKSREIDLISNDIYEIGCEGLRIEHVGDRRKLVSSNITIANNHIHHVGRVFFTPFISMKSAVGVRVAHNLMHDTPKGAVSHYDINNCLFEYNEIHNIALKESDTGTFYGYGGWDTYGNVYRYNFTHHTNRGNGFYCDDGNSGDVHYNNIVHGSIAALKFGGGHDNIGRNNLFVKNKSQKIDDRGISRNYRLGTKYEKRLRAFKPFEEPWLTYGKELQKKFGFTTKLWADVLDEDWHPEWPNGCKMVDNVAVANGPFQGSRHGRIEVARNTMIETLEEAGFHDYENMDLRTNNPLILEKFPNLNKVFPKIGLQKDAYRHTVPTRAQVGGLHNRGSGGDPWDEDQFVD